MTAINRALHGACIVTAPRLHRRLLDGAARREYPGAMKTPRQDPPSQSARNERLAAALKANIARRKAQAKERAAAADAAPDTVPDAAEGEG
jgi:hypothetical protein